MECSECNIETKKARPVNGGILCNSCHRNYNKNILKVEVMRLVKSYETETYPGGVGSVFRCVESSSYLGLVYDIVELISKSGRESV